MRRTWTRPPWVLARWLYLAVALFIAAALADDSAIWAVALIVGGLSIMLTGVLALRDWNGAGEALINYAEVIFGQRPGWRFVRVWGVAAISVGVIWLIGGIAAAL